MPSELAYSEVVDGVVVVGVRVDHIDAQNSHDFKNWVTPDITGAPAVLLDLEGVKFIDSSGLGALLSIMRRINENGGTFQVCSVSPAIVILFELVRMHKILKTFKTRDEAIKAIKSGA